MSEATAIPPFVNKAMKFVLRSPAHGLISKNILVITFTGRTSGKTYSTPVSYSQVGDVVCIFTHAAWWKNLVGGKPVSLRLRGRESRGLAQIMVEDKLAIAVRLGEHLRKVPTDAPYYGVTFDKNGNPRQNELEKGAQTVAMINVHLMELPA
jgi:hypothetical protein